MYVSKEEGEDVEYWMGNRNGCYTVKSGYRFLRIEGNAPLPISEKKFWKNFWNLKVDRKIHIFLWRALNNALPTLVQLKKRNIVEDTRCVFCKEEDETIAHLFRECLVIQRIWAATRLGINAMANHMTTSFFDWAKDLLQLLKHRDQGKDDGALLFACVLQAIWTARKETMYGGVPFNPRVLMWDIERNVLQKSKFSMTDKRGGRNGHSDSETAMEEDDYVNGRHPHTQVPILLVDGAWKKTEGNEQRVRGWNRMGAKTPRYSGSKRGLED